MFKSCSPYILSLPSKLLEFPLGQTWLSLSSLNLSFSLSNLQLEFFTEENFERTNSHAIISKHSKPQHSTLGLQAHRFIIRAFFLLFVFRNRKKLRTVLRKKKKLYLFFFFSTSMILLKRNQTGNPVYKVCAEICN